ncbi:class I SAM-dependent methyltransferase [Clostridium sp.]|uniref:class I SAM-dependent methyltransferase n=1 Tax=Clostridium sp. TaxID=1506 RepID=UPI0026328FE6|nr:class I SAM-dependent methyltransferase [Clostridium sp.]
MSEYKKAEIIAKAKKQFDKDFFTEGYIDIISDDKHLEGILAKIDTKPNSRILDLGTGSGYLAFPLALKHKEIEVVGLDIVENTIRRNNEVVMEKGINNLTFSSYDGITIPYENNTFDAIVTRYALHHFPNIEETIKQLQRIVREGGQIYISDPTPNKIDNKRFVDKYMQLRDDGHVKFYTKEEYIELLNKYGFELENIFISKVRFPRVVSDNYYKLMKNYEEEIIKAYDIEVTEDKIFITEDVLNMSFRKK